MRWAAVVLAAGLIPFGYGAEPFLADEGVRVRLVALTFDDLPAARESFQPSQLADAKAFRRRTTRFLRRLSKRSAPVAGFVNGGFKPDNWTREDGVELLQIWRNAGATLGNHTYRHEDIQAATPDEYFESIAVNQRYLDEAQVVEGDVKYFRAPNLHRGETEQDRAVWRAHLSAQGYTTVPVSLDLQDWLFAPRYASAGDPTEKEAVVEAYLEYLGAALDHYASLARYVLGREVPHIALLHANALNMDQVDRVLAVFEERGFRFTDIQTALRDRAYAFGDQMSGSALRTWQSQQRLPFAEAPDPYSFLPGE